MANSRKLNSELSTDEPETGSSFAWSPPIAAWFASVVPAHASVVVALSGGMDSVVLLHILSTLRSRFPFTLSACHVHHGISPNADAWADFCSQLCAHWQLPLQIERVDISQLKQQVGVEAAARQQRYAAFSRGTEDFVALAHHADDQAETLLLQLLRGAGVKGAAAMPRLKSGKPSLLRPLLEVSRQELLAYAEAHQLRWIEDESNDDVRYARNFLRHRVLPVLAEKFPAYRTTLARSAQHFADSSVLLDELAQQDSIAAFDNKFLIINELKKLSPARGKNLLRYFLQQHQAPIPQQGQLEQIWQQLCFARDDAAVCVHFAGWEMHRYQGRALLFPALPEIENTAHLVWQREAELLWQPLNKRLIFKQIMGKGMSLARLQQAPLTLRLRCGGETLRPHHQAATRTLKQLFQQRQIPPWERERLPLLFCGETLVSVPGVAVQAEFQARENELGLEVEWASKP